MNISRKIQNVGEDHQQGESKFQGIFKKKNLVHLDESAPVDLEADESQR